jgi:hypothetical protein
MEKVKDILDSIGERLKSPLIFSFFISWLIINWRVIVCLFWFDRAILLSEGYNSQVEYIESKLNVWKSFILPLGGALIYIFGYPYIRNAIAVFRTGITVKGEIQRMEAGKIGMISIDKYIAKVKSVEEQKKRLEMHLASEATAIAEKESEITSLRHQVTNLNREIQRHHDTFDKHGEELHNLANDLEETKKVLRKYEESEKSSRLDGDWTVRVGSLEYEWRFYSGKISQLDEKSYYDDIGHVHYINWNSRNGTRLIMALVFNSGITTLGNLKMYKNKILLELNSSASGSQITGVLEDEIPFSLKKISN